MPEPEPDYRSARPELPPVGKEPTPTPANDVAENVKPQINELAAMAKAKKVPFEIIAKKYSVKGWVDFTAKDKIKLIAKVKEYLAVIPDAK